MSHLARRRPLRRRGRLIAPLLVVALAATSACVRNESRATSGGTGNGEPVTKTNLPDCPIGALAEADGPVAIELWHALGGESQNELIDLATTFNASQDEVRVELRNQGSDYAEVLRKYVAGIPSGQLPAIAYLEDTTLRQIVDSGTILPAEACEKADGFETGQLPVVRNYYTSEDIYWPGYTNVSEPILYYNANQFARAGLDAEAPPQTLAEVRTAAEALKASGVKSPLALKLDEWFVESWINGAGEGVTNMDNGREGLADVATFDNPVTREVYTWIKGMADDGLLVGYSDTAGQINQYLAVAQENSAMTIETSTAATTIKAVLGGKEFSAGGVSTGDADLSGVAPLAGPFPGVEEPSQVRVSGGAFFMSNGVPPEQQAGAWEFMKFMWETANQVSWHLVGSYLPTTQAAASSPEVTAYWEDDLAGKLLKEGYDELVAIDPERPGPQIGPYTDYSDAIKNSLDRLVLQGASVDDAVTGAQDEIQEALTRYVEDNG